jgi:dolichol-phosphate mannosyltransferase
MANENISGIHHPSVTDTSVGTSIIVPAFNESESIIPLRDRLLPVIRSLMDRGGVEVIFVDDGSTDGTDVLVGDAFRNAVDVDVRLVKHPENRGVGAAIATGFSNAVGDIVCVIDSDCSYDPEDLPKLIDLLFSQEADIVTASPYHPEGRVVGCPAWRIALSRMASLAYSVVSPTRLYCYTSMVRVYRRAWARPELCTSPGFVGVAEQLIQSAIAGARIVEFPATLRSRIHGQSKMRTISVATHHLRLMVRLLFDRTPVTGKAEDLSRNHIQANFDAALQTFDAPDKPADLQSK